MVLAISKNILTFKFNQNATILKKHFLPKMNLLLSTFVCLCLCTGTMFGQTISDENSGIYLVSSLDSTKKIHLKQKGTMELHYEFDFADSLIESKSSYLQGKIERVSDTTLSFQTWSENTYLTYYSGIETDSYTQYTSDYIKEIRINQIECLQYNSPVRESFHGIGNLTASLGTIAAVLVAPLVSINFKNGDFNKNRYYTVAGCGLIGLAVSIPIIALTKSKEYRLLEKDADPERDYWYLESTIQK